jgi:hypothetical protein
VEDEGVEDEGETLLEMRGMRKWRMREWKRMRESAG